MHFSLAAAEIDVFENLAEFINPWAAVRGSPRPRWREILFLEFDRLRVAYASRELLITRYRGAVCGIVVASSYLAGHGFADRLTSSDLVGQRKKFFFSAVLIVVVSVLLLSSLRRRHRDRRPCHSTGRLIRRH